MSTGGSGKKPAPKSAGGGGDKTKDAPAGTAARRRVVIALVALVVVAGGIIVWALTMGEDSPPGVANPGTEQSTEPTSSSSPGQTGSEGVTPPPAQSDGGEQIQLEPVPLDERAPFGDQVSGELVDLSAVEAEGQGVGEISGPALRVTVRLLNGTSEPLSLDAATVSMYFGSDLTPAPPISDGTVPFRGSLAPGESAEGVYTFSIGEDDRDDLSITVSHSPGSAVVVFNGAFS